MPTTSALSIVEVFARKVSLDIAWCNSHVGQITRGQCSAGLANIAVARDSGRPTDWAAATIRPSNGSPGSKSLQVVGRKNLVGCEGPAADTPDC